MREHIVGIVIRKATVNDAGQVADVMNAVIAEGKYTLLDRPFSEEEERAFILSLSLIGHSQRRRKGHSSCRFGIEAPYTSQRSTGRP